MSKFSERLRQLRTSKDLSQMDFAKQIKLSKSSINMYERGEREPGLETLERIADYFNVDMDYLLGKSDIANRSHLAFASIASNIIIQSGYWDGSRLAEERISRGHSISYISSKLEITEEDYRRLESGVSEPSFKLLLLMSQFFGFDLDYICHRMAKVNSFPSPFVLSDFEINLIEKYRRLSYANQITLQSVLDGFLGTEESQTPAKEA